MTATMLSIRKDNMSKVIPDEEWFWYKQLGWQIAE